ncbi:MAG: AraC family transcriptional regulator [Cellvibrionaceae bacterium]|nr:AraC family transcriptional regulator [Cellvibrionaceae bacterium]
MGIFKKKHPAKSSVVKSALDNNKTAAEMMILPKHQLFHSDNLDFVRAEVAKVYCDHKLGMARGSRLNAQHHHAKMSNISLNYMRYGNEVEIEPGELDRFFLIQLPLSGWAEINSGKESAISTEHCASIPSPNKHLSMRWSEDCEQLMVQIPRQAIEQKLSAMISRPLNQPLEFDLLMQGDQPKVRAWWRLIDYMLTEFESICPITNSPGAEHMEQLIITQLLHAQRHNYSDALQAKGQSIAPAHVKKAEEYIRNHITQAITIDDLVQETGVSPRSLHEGFRKFRGQSPLSYLRALRLEHARNDLLAANGDSVTNIATRWGFTQLGRFSVTYKEVYGESPSETFKKALY